MYILAVGHNHDTAPVEIRERFSFGPERMRDALERSLECPGVREAVIISTCNRNEIYTVVSDPESAAHHLDEFVHDFHNVERGLVSHSLYRLHQESAVEHLFSVASGVDSMVVGETQVAGQLKDAFGLARQASSAGPILNRLFDASFEVGKKVRQHTRVSQGSVSVSSCAVELASKIFTGFRDKSVLLVGAGENSEHTARILSDRGARRFVVVNRTVERAAALADRLGGAGLPIERLHDAVRNADIVITSLSAAGTLLSDGDIRLAMSRRGSRPLLLIDLSVPRIVATEARLVENVFLYDVDDLSTIADENRTRRQDEVLHARDIISGEVTAFMQWYRELDAAPTIVSLRSHFEALRQEEVERHRGKLSDDAFEAFERASRTLVGRLLHPPTEEIRRATREGDGPWLALALRRLFGLTEHRDE